MTMSIGLLVFPDMEMLDYAGPYQVFATASKVTSQTQGLETFSLVTIGATLDPVRVRAGAVLVPQATIHDHPELSCLVVPGGMAGVQAQVDRGELVDWITAQAETVPIIASVCTGAFLLAQTGLLNGLEATTHQNYASTLRQRFPSIEVHENQRWVDAGRFVTSAGLSTGIDMSLYLVERLASRELSVLTAKALEL